MERLRVAATESRSRCFHWRNSPLKPKRQSSSRCRSRASMANGGTVLSRLISSSSRAAAYVHEVPNDRRWRALRGCGKLLQSERFAELDFSRVPGHSVSWACKIDVPLRVDSCLQEFPGPDMKSLFGHRRPATAESVLSERLHGGIMFNREALVKLGQVRWWRKRSCSVTWSGLIRVRPRPAARRKADR